MRFAVLAFAVLLCGRSLHAQAVSFQRIAGVHELEITLRGTAVVRDSASWATLWHRFGPRHYADTGSARSTAPRVDFTRHMLAIVADGPGSGCHNQASYVRRIVERSDSIVVDMLPDTTRPFEIPVTCAMEVHRIDVVRLPRIAKPVAFLGQPRWLPPPARWLAKPDLAWIGGASDQERVFFLRAWARDPRTPPGVAASMAHLPAEWIWKISEDLLKRPDVRRNPRAMAALAALPGPAGADARQLLRDNMSPPDNTTP